MPGRRVVVITGASRGIGAGVVAGYRSKGWNVVANARVAPASNDPAVFPVAGDVALPSTAELLVSAALDRFGRIDTYVSNAMVTVYAEAHRLSDDELRRVFDVNFFGGVYGFWAALPRLRDTRGTYMQIASALAYLHSRSPPIGPASLVPFSCSFLFHSGFFGICSVPLCDHGFS